jgi:DNA polymerase (family 10)
MTASTPQVIAGRAAASAHNADIATAFSEIADILEIEGANPFRVRAYRNAARVVGGLPTEVTAMIARGDDLSELPGIGKDLAKKIADLAATGTTPLLAELHKHLPAATTELLRLPGLGPKRVKVLHDALGIETLPELRRALQDGRVRQQEGFGEGITRQLLQAIEAQSGSPGRMKLAVAAQYAEALLTYLQGVPGASKVAIAGSYRRGRETVGDLDIVSTAPKAASIIAAFIRYPETARVLAQGPHRGTITLRCGLQVDIRVIPPRSYGAAMVYFTGSKAHNIAIRRIGQSRGLKINEYGVFRGGRRIAGETEESVYRAVGLPLIPPELREDQGEIDAAREGRLPDLVTTNDIRGDLHVHTTASDGRNSLREMAVAAKKRGYEYMAITEHSRRVTVAHGLDPARLTRQISQIDRLNGEDPGIDVLKGIEVDILDNGSLDLPDSILSRLDIVIGAIHS